METFTGLDYKSELIFYNGPPYKPIITIVIPHIIIDSEGNLIEIPDKQIDSNGILTNKTKKNKTMERVIFLKKESYTNMKFYFYQPQPQIKVDNVYIDSTKKNIYIIKSLDEINISFLFIKKSVFDQKKNSITFDEEFEYREERKVEWFKNKLIEKIIVPFIEDKELSKTI